MRWIRFLVPLLFVACGGKVWSGPEGATDPGDDPSPIPPPSAASTTPPASPRGVADAAAPPEDVRTNPFRAGDVWLGGYTCAQGLTQLWLRIVAVEGDRITDAVFDFTYDRIHGAFHTTGTYYPLTGTASFAPGDWIQHPNGYVTVALDGALKNGGRTYEGNVTGPRCTTFSLVRTP